MAKSRKYNPIRQSRSYAESEGHSYQPTNETVEDLRKQAAAIERLDGLPSRTVDGLMARIKYMQRGWIDREDEW